MNATLTAQEFELFRGLIESSCGIALDERKTYLVETRLSHLLDETGRRSYGELQRAATVDAALRERIIDCMTTNETSWFRDATCFDALRRFIVPELVEQARKDGRTRIRVWSAACSTGQEPYSLAILADEMERAGELKDVGGAEGLDIIATDICRSALEIARRARYDPVSMRRGLDDRRRARHFELDGRVSTVSEKIRKRVRFVPFNLLDPFDTLGRFDLVLMRNVLIYFAPEGKKRVLERVRSVLRSGAVFVAGSTEAVEIYTQDFAVQRYGNFSFYRAKDGVR